MGNRRNREILKSYFRSGSAPTESQFAELIDSVPNFAEEGQIRTKREGLLLYPGGGDGRMASAYIDPEELQEKGRVPCWSFVLGDEKEFFVMNERGETVLSLTQDRQVHTYDDREVEKQKGKEEKEYHEMAADGYWHDLPVEFASAANASKCCIYHITASYRTGRNKYRMTNVIASYCKGTGLKISSPQKRWGCWMSPIRLRWNRREEGTFLQMRGKEKKHGGSVIHYLITELYAQVD